MNEHKNEKNPNETIFNSTRRHYPQNNFRGKDEWHGLILHLNDVSDEITNIEKKIKHIKMKNFVNDLDYKLLDNLNKQKIQLQEKEEELRKIKTINEENLNVKLKYKQDKLLLQQNLRNQYDREVNDLNIRKKQAKENSLKMDQYLLDLEKQKINEKIIAEAKKKEFEEKEGKSNLNLQEFRNKKNFSEKLKQKQEDIDLIKRNIINDLKKEENQNDFWKKIAENQFNLFQIHKNNYFEPELQRQNKLNENILKNMEDQNKKREIEEFERAKKKREDHILATMENKMLIQKKNEDLKNINDKNKKIREEFFKEENQNEKYEEYLKKKKLESQLSYRDFLDKQRIERTMCVINGNRMNKIEKLYNFEDLQAYKNNEKNFYSKLPGWRPQVGSLGKKQLADLMKVNPYREEINLNLSPEKSNYNNFPSMNKEINKEFNELNLKNNENEQEIKNYIPRSRELIKRNLGVFSSDQKLKSNSQNRVFSGKNESDNNFDYGKRNNSLNYGHNPIVNPTPFNVQNPYIKKEYAKILNLN